MLALQPDHLEISQISVFTTPAAPAGSLGRYEMFLLASAPPEPFRTAGTPVPPACRSAAGAHCTYRFRSADGLRWTATECIDPGTDGSDGSFVYRQADGSYAAYIKASYPILLSSAALLTL